MAPSIQKALTVPEPKAPWKLVTDWPVPTPGPNEVLVKVVTAAINPADAMIQTYGVPFITQYPFIGGLDGAGVIEELGSEVQELQKGDQVLFPGGFEPKYASFQEYKIVPAENVAKIPDNLSFEQAATVPLGLATVATGTWSHHPEARSIDLLAPWEEGGMTKYVGQAAFVSGGSSSVGQYAIQMAKLQGFSPIITTSSLKHEEWLKSLGATHVIDRSLPIPDILAELPKITGGKPILYAFDAIGAAETQNMAYDALAPGGALVQTRALSLDPGLQAKIERDGGSKKVVGPFASLQVPGNKALGVELYKRLTEWLETGVVVPNRFVVLPGGLTGIPEGCERLKSNKVSGEKLVVRIGETP
ncbi:GroES-like protein [Earliella scabrosa]|nr:GroES-like protein [Earliella scabrosa]